MNWKVHYYFLKTINNSIIKKKFMSEKKLLKSLKKSFFHNEILDINLLPFLHKKNIYEDEYKIKNNIILGVNNISHSYSTINSTLYNNKNIIFDSLNYTLLSHNNVYEEYSHILHIITKTNTVTTKINQFRLLLDKFIEYKNNINKSIPDEFKYLIQYNYSIFADKFKYISDNAMLINDHDLLIYFYKFYEKYPEIYNYKFDIDNQFNNIILNSIFIYPDYLPTLFRLNYHKKNIINILNNVNNNANTYSKYIDYITTDHNNYPRIMVILLKIYEICESKDIIKLNYNISNMEVLINNIITNYLSINNGNLLSFILMIIKTMLFSDNISNYFDNGINSINLDKLYPRDLCILINDLYYNKKFKKYMIYIISALETHICNIVNNNNNIIDLITIIINNITFLTDQNKLFLVKYAVTKSIKNNNITDYEISNLLHNSVRLNFEESFLIYNKIKVPDNIDFIKHKILEHGDIEKKFKYIGKNIHINDNFDIYPNII